MKCLIHFITSLFGFNGSSQKHPFWTYFIPNLFHSEPILFRTYFIPNLFYSEPILFRTYFIPNIHSEPIWFWTHLILNPSDSEPIWFWTHLILNPSDSEPIWFWTHLILNLSDTSMPSDTEAEACFFWANPLVWHVLHTLGQFDVKPLQGRPSDLWHLDPNWLNRKLVVISQSGVKGGGHLSLVTGCAHWTKGGLEIMGGNITRTWI